MPTVLEPLRIVDNRHHRLTQTRPDPRRAAKPLDVLLGRRVRVQLLPHRTDRTLHLAKLPQLLRQLSPPPLGRIEFRPELRRIVAHAGLILQPLAPSVRPSSLAGRHTDRLPVQNRMDRVLDHRAARHQRLAIVDQRPPFAHLLRREFDLRQLIDRRQLSQLHRVHAIRLVLDPSPAPTLMAGIGHLKLDLHPHRQVRHPARSRPDFDHYPIGLTPSEQILQNRRLRTHRLEPVHRRLALVIARHALHFSKINR